MNIEYTHTHYRICLFYRVFDQIQFFGHRNRRSLTESEDGDGDDESDSVEESDHMNAALHPSSTSATTATNIEHLIKSVSKRLHKSPKHRHRKKETQSKKT